jgi:hypothetical protein
VLRIRCNGEFYAGADTFINRLFSVENHIEVQTSAIKRDSSPPKL